MGSMKRRRFLLTAATFVSGAAPLARGADQSPTPEFEALRPSLEDPSQGWESLFNGRDLDLWNPLQDPGRAPKPFDWEIATDVWLDPDDPKKLVRKREPYSGNSRAFVNNQRGKSDSPITKKNYADIELYLESMVAQGSNSGICMMGLYEIQIRDSFGRTELNYGDNGGIYARMIGDKRVGGEPPRFNASRPPGEWESFHVWFRAPRYDRNGKKTQNASFLRVVHNGRRIHDEFELTGSTRGWSPWEEKPQAPLLLQGDHGPVAFRNVYIRTLRTT